MTREEMIEELKGEIIRVDGEWLKENDNEMLEWLTGSEYWCRGFEDMEIIPKDAVLEMKFESRGVAYKATFQGHPDGIGQSLNNQPIWSDDSWDDWDDEEIEIYYKKLKEENKMYRIDFGKFDDNRNFEWNEIRKIMQSFEGFAGDLSEITFDSREEAEEMLEKIQNYIDSSIVEIVEN